MADVGKIRHRSRDGSIYLEFAAGPGNRKRRLYSVSIGGRKMKWTEDFAQQAIAGVGQYLARLQSASIPMRRYLVVYLS